MMTNEEWCLCVCHFAHLYSFFLSHFPRITGCDRNSMRGKNWDTDWRGNYGGGMDGIKQMDGALV